MRCMCGEDAILLLVRSERIYLDILHHEMFCDGDKDATFNISVHIFEFFSGFDPDLEFRGFVSKGRRTALTIYNPWVYDETIVKNSDKISALILSLWDLAAVNIRSQDYSLDFAVAPDLSHCWIVELNDFLPPLAGSGLFDFHKDSDRQVIFQGPFEFRVRSTPVVKADFTREVVNQQTGERKMIIMQPETDEVMELVRAFRNAQHGVFPPSASQSNSRSHCIVL